MQISILNIVFFLIVINVSFGQQKHSDKRMQSIIDFDKEYYFAKTKKGYWGLYNTNKKNIIKSEYDTLFALCDVKFDKETYQSKYIKTGYVIGRKGERYELLNLKGEVTLSVGSIMPRWMKGVVLVRNKKEWGLVKTSGEIILPISCTEIEWHDDLLALKNGEKWTLFHPKRGKIVENAIYDEIQNTFSYSGSNNYVPKRFLVKKDGKWGVIDKNGNIVISIEYNQIDKHLTRPKVNRGLNTIERQLFRVKKGDKWMLVDLDGKLFEGEAVE